MTLIDANSAQPRRLTGDPLSCGVPRCRLPGRRRRTARRYTHTPIGPTVTQTLDRGEGAAAGEGGGVAAGEGEEKGGRDGAGEGDARPARAGPLARRSRAPEDRKPSRAPRDPRRPRAACPGSGPPPGRGDWAAGMTQAGSAPRAAGGWAGSSISRTDTVTNST
jgi:hypothetical protein